MSLRSLGLVLGLVAIPSLVLAHDLFLTLRDYFVAPLSVVRIVGLNGTFTTSENSIDRARVADLTVLAPSGRKSIDSVTFKAEGPRTVITLETREEGTYAAGLSTKPSELSETAADFNKYLAEEGIGWVLADRKRTKEQDKPVKEQYSKHVKTLFQVGRSRSEGWSTVLGYPVEIMPLRNPYALGPADTLRFRILVDGKPSPAGQEVLAGGRTRTGARRVLRRLVTDSLGEVTVPLRPTGVWYVKFIRMTRSDKAGLDYISQWATLTFAVAAAPGKAQ
ncbi:MAG TPA: DUF4198 domain-containing protein [Gemmatimonadales bacterium]|nr:DUF4198 domain-containing protein [Gemmatimonadales bacterium]